MWDTKKWGRNLTKLNSPETVSETTAPKFTRIFISLTELKLPTKKNFFPVEANAPFYAKRCKKTLHVDEHFTAIHFFFEKYFFMNQTEKQQDCFR